MYVSWTYAYVSMEAPGDSEMNGRVGSLLLALLLAALLPVTVAEAQPPIHQVGERWTAWDPPDTPPPEGAQVYLVQPGDTLWGLAEEFLGDPYRWPQLWEANRYILDAEWIYPGDPLIVPGTDLADADGVAGPSITDPPVTGEPSAEDPFAVEPREEPVDVSRFSTPPEFSSDAPIPLGFESDIHCTGYIGELKESFPYRISGSEYEFNHPQLEITSFGVEGEFGKSDTVKYLLGVGDIVYLEGGRADGLSAGTVLVAIQPQRKVIHPRTRKLVGRLYHYTARVRILSVQEETSIGEIVYGCDPVSIGATLRIFEPEPVPLRRMTPIRPPSFPSTIEEVEAGPSIILSRDNVITLGAGTLVFIDRGWDDVAPGDIFTIYRRARKGFPPIVLGELAVLSVTDRAALARILRSRYTIYLGDSMVLK